MFELIGLLFATGLLFAVALCIAALLVVLIWLLLKNNGRRRPFLWAAGLIPVFSAVHLWICIAVLPHESLFGDISQPLPNGYRLEALGKMHDFATISKLDATYSVGVSECIGSLMVYGPLVVGQYSHPFGSFEAAPNEAFFVFDTRDGHHADLPSRDELEHDLGHVVALEVVQRFHSREPAYQRQMRVNHAIMFGPPILALGLLISIVLLRRQQIPTGSSKTYT